MDERLLFAVVIRTLIVAAAVANLRDAWLEYRHFADARGLRGFVAAISFLGGAAALATSSPVIDDRLGPAFAPALAIVTGAAVMVFLAGLIFSTFSWRLGR